MIGNNLPPGMSESDLPGNRPDEETGLYEIELEQGEINVRMLLEKGYDAYDDIDCLLAKYGDAVNVPEKEGTE